MIAIETCDLRNNNEFISHFLSRQKQQIIINIYIYIDDLVEDLQVIQALQGILETLQSARVSFKH